MELLRAAVELVEGCPCGGSGGGGVGGGGGGASGGGGGGGGGSCEDAGGCQPGSGSPNVRDVGDTNVDADQTGCPGCVHYLSCDKYNAVLDKRAALVVLRATIDAEVRAFAPTPSGHPASASPLSPGVARGATAGQQSEGEGRVHGRGGGGRTEEKIDLAPSVVTIDGNEDTTHVATGVASNAGLASTFATPCEDSPGGSACLCCHGGGAAARSSRRHISRGS